MRDEKIHLFLLVTIFVVESSSIPSYSPFRFNSQFNAHTTGVYGHLQKNWPYPFGSVRAKASY